jgi:hypothetical protein
MVFSSSDKKKEKEKKGIDSAKSPESAVPPAPAPQRPPKSPESDVLKKTVMNDSPDLKEGDDAVEKMKEKFVLKPPERKHPKMKIKPPKKKLLPKPKVIVREVRKVREMPERELLGKEVDKVFDEALRNKEKIQELLSMKKDVELLKSKVEGPAFKNLEDIIYNEFDKMNKIIEENKEKEKDFAESMKTQVDSMRKEIDGMKKVEEKLKALDVEGFRRDLESVKQKVKWVEDHIEAFDIMPLVELLKDVETRVNDLKVSSPVIID